MTNPNAKHEQEELEREGEASPAEEVCVPHRLYDCSQCEFEDDLYRLSGEDREVTL